MLNNRIIAVFKREVRERVISKGFILMTILLPLFMFGLIGIQVLLMKEDSTKFNITIISESLDLTNKLQNELLLSDAVKEGNVILQFNTMSQEDFRNFLTSKKQDVLDEKVTGILYVPESALKDKKIEYYSKTPQNRRLSELLNRPINKVLIDTYFSNRALSMEELNFARQGLDVTGFKVSKEEGFEEAGYGSLILTYLFTFLLYISLLMMGQMIMQSVIEEKSSRIVEVILSSVSAKELMIGKILGSGVTGLLQMAIWLTPVIMVASTTWFMLPPEVSISLTTFQIVYFLINFFLGLVIFLGLFATVGAIFDNPQDAQSGLWPVMLLIIIPFFIAFSMIENPNSAIARISSFVPFANIIVMPARMTIADVPVFQLFLSLFISVATLITIFPLAGKIYRIGVLRTGKKPKWSEVVKWIKYKY
ncbi:MAG TPA: ABC transporter permease [Melioribacteraceae bacterium]|nr:ABC transporter permease [Melioribacteraceae bacterium]